MAAAAGGEAPAPSSQAGLLSHRAALALLDGEAMHAVVLYRRAVAAATGGQAAGFDAGPGPRGRGEEAALAWAGLARALLADGRAEDAAEAAVEAAAAHPAEPQAWLAQGAARFALGEFHLARRAFLKAQDAGGPPRKLAEWLRKVDCELDLAAAAAAPAAAPTAAPAKAAAKAAAPAPAPAAPAPAEKPQAEKPAAAAEKPQAEKPQARYRHEWYQTAGAVTVGVLAKRCRPEAVAVAIGPRSLRVDVRDLAAEAEAGAEAGAEPAYRLEVELSGAVDPAASSHAVLGSRIEVKLAKAAPGVQWPTLERPAPAEAAASAGAPADAGAAPVTSFAAVGEAKPRGYPSSSKKGTDWGALDAELAGELEQDAEGLQGDAALNKLFQDIYAKADPETRRAMNKSFQESNGTVLSTNWSEIGKGYVNGQPPDGMEVRKYGE